MDFILHKPAAASKVCCGHYIELFEECTEFHCDGQFINTYGERIVDPRVKKCKEIFLDQYRFFQPIESCMTESILEYKKKYSSVDLVSTWGIDPVFKVQKYLPNEGYFKTHCENGGFEDSNRILAWMIYLNDVYDDGYTVFPNQEKKFQPRTGDLLVWPAHFTHPHHGVTSKTETKYILTGWFTYTKGDHPWDKVS